MPYRVPDVKNIIQLRSNKEYLSNKQISEHSNKPMKNTKMWLKI